MVWMLVQKWHRYKADGISVIQTPIIAMHFLYHLDHLTFCFINTSVQQIAWTWHVLGSRMPENGFLRSAGDLCFNETENNISSNNVTNMRKFENSTEVCSVYLLMLISSNEVGLNLINSKLCQWRLWLWPGELNSRINLDLISASATLSCWKKINSIIHISLFCGILILAHNQSQLYMPFVYAHANLCYFRSEAVRISYLNSSAGWSVSCE